MDRRELIKMAGLAAGSSLLLPSNTTRGQGNLLYK